MQRENYLFFLSRLTMLERDIGIGGVSLYDYVFHLTCVMPIPGKRFRQFAFWRKTKQLNSKND